MTTPYPRRASRARMLMSIALMVAACGPAVEAGSGPAEHPEWLHALIREIEAAPARNPPARITSDRYRGEIVYHVPAYCCDRPSVLYDAAGTVICRPEGGITGRGDGRCADFRAERSDPRPVWSDPRG